MVGETENENSKEGLHQFEEPRDRLRKIFNNLNGRMMKQDAIEMGFELLLAERDELIEYIKALKNLAIYLTGRTNIQSESLSGDYYLRAEENFPEYMRREMDIGKGE